MRLGANPVASHRDDQKHATTGSYDTSVSPKCHQVGDFTAGTENPHRVSPSDDCRIRRSLQLSGQGAEMAMRPN